VFFIIGNYLKNILHMGGWYGSNKIIINKNTQK
jgi:hypothetical protein